MLETETGCGKFTLTENNKRKKHPDDAMQKFASAAVRRRMWKQWLSRMQIVNTTLLRRSNNDLSRRRFMSVSCGDGVKCEDDSLPLDAPFVERAIRRESASRSMRAWNVVARINGSRITRVRNGTLGTCGRTADVSRVYKPSLKTLARFLASCHVQGVARIAKNYVHRVM